MGKDEIIKTLVEFFLNEFVEDGLGVANWVAQGGQDIDQLYVGVIRLKRELALRD